MCVVFLLLLRWCVGGVGAQCRSKPKCACVSRRSSPRSQSLQRGRRVQRRAGHGVCVRQKPCVRRRTVQQRSHRRRRVRQASPAVHGGQRADVQVCARARSSSRCSDELSGGAIHTATFWRTCAPPRCGQQCDRKRMHAVPCAAPLRRCACGSRACRAARRRNPLAVPAQKQTHAVVSALDAASRSSAARSRTSQSPYFSMNTPQSQPFICSGMSEGALRCQSDTSSAVERLCCASSEM